MESSRNMRGTSYRRIIGKQACAACRYHRRKCPADCIFVPYFPYETHQEHFLNAQRLFGVSNIARIVGSVAPADKDAAMRTIIFESNARAADPVHGCVGIIRDLHRQIDHATAELHTVRRHLALYRQQEAPTSDDIDGADQS